MKTMRKLLVTAVALTSLLTASVAFAEKSAAPVAKADTAQMQSENASQEKQPVLVSDKVNINTASAAEIQKALIGIGAKKAEAVVQYREKHGAFTAAEQLMEVQGIGKATLEKNKDRIAF